MSKCRVCLTEGAAEQFDWNAALYANITHAQAFRHVTALEFDTKERCRLCENCCLELKNAYEFVEKARQAEHLLKLKQEPTPCCTPYVEREFEWVDLQKQQSVEELETTTNAINEATTICCRTTNIALVENDTEKQLQDALTLKTEPTESEKQCKTKRNTRNVKQNDNNSNAETTCDYCTKTLTRQQMKKHITREHKQEILLCHACPRTFKNVKYLEAHAQTHEENRERNYACNQCERKFYTKAAYHNHVKLHDPQRKLYKCDQCDKSFYHKGSLKLHQKYHSGDMIECNICQKRYARFVDLQVHLRCHSGDLPYKCPHCERAFRQVSLLNKHVLYHEGYRYKCDICAKEYMHQATLIQHRKEHTGLPLKCALCDKAFVKTSKMRRHIGNVHKIKEVEEMDKLTIKVKTKRKYRGRIIDV